MININRLKDIREDNDISQEEMADILGINRSTYSLWELGINVIQLKALCNFADYFDCSIDYVLGLTKNKNKHNLIKGLDLKVIGNNLKQLRIKNKLSQLNVADLLGVSQACIVRYEKGLICISTQNVYKLAKEFKVSINDLCGKTKK